MQLQIHKRSLKNSDAVKSQLIVKVASQVMDEMEYKTVANCIRHCKYDLN